MHSQEHQSNWFVVQMKKVQINSKRDSSNIKFDWFDLERRIKIQLEKFMKMVVICFCKSTLHCLVADLWGFNIHKHTLSSVVVMSYCWNQCSMKKQTFSSSSEQRFGFSSDTERFCWVIDWFHDSDFLLRLYEWTQCRRRPPSEPSYGRAVLNPQGLYIAIFCHHQFFFTAQINSTSLICHINLSAFIFDMKFLYSCHTDFRLLKTC